MTGMAGVWVGEAVAVGLDVALKSTALIVAAAILQLLGRRRVLVASAIGNACLVGLLALPLVAVACPGLRIDCLTTAGDPAFATAFARTDRDEPQERGTIVEAIGPADGSLSPVEGPREPARASWSESAAWIAAIVYGLVLVALLARLIGSLLAVAWLRRSSRPEGDPAWVEALGRWRSRLGLSRPIRLARSGRVGVPVVVGGRRATIILPERLEAKGPRAIDAILLHELAHVRRGDYGWNIVLRLVQAIYWPQPLVWPLGRLVAAARERACDDLCVHGMGGPDDYRAALLGVAAGLVGRRPEPGLGMAMSRSTNLGRRLARLERSAGASRCLLGWPARLAIAAAVLGAAGLLGSLRLGRAAAAQVPDEPKPTKPDPAAEARPTDPVQEPAKPPTGAIRKPDKDRVPKVTLAEVRRGPLTRTTTQAGTLVAARSVDLYPRVTGYLTSMEVDIGDRVKQGQVLATIDAPELKSEMTKQEAVARHAQIKVRRARAAVAAAEAAIEVEKARSAEARSDLERVAATVEFRTKERARLQQLVLNKSVEQSVVDEQEEKYGAAVAGLDSAKAKVQTVAALLKQREAELEDVKAALEETELDEVAARADLDKAKAMADFTRVVAPFDGVVTRRAAHRGVLVRAPSGPNAQTILSLTQEGRMRLAVDVPSKIVPLLDVGDPATVRIDAFRGQTFRGKVARMDYALDPGNGTLHAEIDLAETDIKLRPGQFGTVTIELETIPDQLSIPGDAYNGNDAEGPIIYRLDGDRAVRIKGVKVGDSIGSRLVIEAGLKEGDRVLSPMFGLEDGMKVEVVTPEERAKDRRRNFQ